MVPTIGDLNAKTTIKSPQHYSRISVAKIRKAPIPETIQIFILPQT